MARTNRSSSQYVFALSIALALSAAVSAAETPDKIQQAINVVETLCLSGSGYSVSADTNGNITVKNFRPNEGGSVTLNVRESRGATAFQDDLRIISDDKIRNCTQHHIGRVLDAIFEYIPAEKTKGLANNSVQSAKYLGYVPQIVSADGFVEMEEKAYYRFSVKEPADVRIHVEKNSSTLRVSLVTEKQADIGGYISAGGRYHESYLLEGDYYVVLTNTVASRATSYRLVVESFAANK